MSYLHVAWLDRETIESDKNSKQKLQNYLKKVGSGSTEDEEYFDPEFLQVLFIEMICLELGRSYCS
jgi:hypothetical protein